MAAAASDTAPAGDFLGPTFFLDHDTPAVATVAAEACAGIDSAVAAERAVRP